MARILVVDTQSESAPDHRDVSKAIGEHLSRAGHIIQYATDAASALHRLKAWKPQLLVIDCADLLALVPRIRALSPDDYTAVLLAAEDTDPGLWDVALTAGVDDFLIAPYPEHELLARVRAGLKHKEAQDTARKLQDRADELATTDDTTGLMNLKSLYRRGEEELQRARRFQKPLSGLLVNLDSFSGVNRERGFETGNRVLKEAAGRIRGCLRTIDLAARLGADEFFVLLAETDLAGAEFVAERIRDAIRATPLGGPTGAALTACVGIGSLRKAAEGQVIGDLLRSASEALKSAKGQGPDRIEIDSFVIKA